MTENKIPTNRGFNILGLVVLLALVPLIAWFLNFIINKDFSQQDQPKKIVVENTESQTVVPAVTPVATSTATTTQATSSPKTTPAKPPVTQTTPTKPVATSTTNTNTSTVTVTLTDEGFSPATVTVSRGQSVTFVNDSSSKMWVAANPFPSSSEYPDFNQKASVTKGESWSFTFEESGTWFYHNHYSPATGAKVVVSWK